MRSLIMLLFVFVAPAFAHKLCVEPKFVGDHIRVEAFYEDNTPAQEAKITVRNGGAVVAEGRTDEKGVWTCTLPPGDYTVKAETLGHVADPQPVTVAEKPAESPSSVESDDHADKTRTPWGRIALGLGIIVGAAALGLLFKRALRPATRN
jgi:nickel transport protein